MARPLSVVRHFSKYYIFPEGAIYRPEMKKKSLDYAAKNNLPVLEVGPHSTQDIHASVVGLQPHASARYTGVGRTGDCGEERLGRFVCENRPPLFDIELLCCAALPAS